MKSKGYILLLIVLTGILFSCRKNLNQPPTGSLDLSTLANKKGVEGLLIGAYARLDGIALTPYPTDFLPDVFGAYWVFGSISGTEAYKGSFDFDAALEITPLETFNAAATNTAVAYRWTALYTGVARSNEVLFVMKQATDISPQEAKRISGEARFLRGFYHFEAAKTWGKVPYVDETVRYEDDNYLLSNDTLIWGAIKNDFRYAMENLPEEMPAIGRANKYAAAAFLVKTLLFEAAINPASYAEARVIVNDILVNGKTAGGQGYALMEKYHDNFNPETKNNSESIFAVQMSVNDGGDGINGNAPNIMNYPVGLPGMCCSFFQPSQFLVNHFKTFENGLPDLDNFNEHPVKNDENISPDEPFVPYEGLLDPRLDWTVGRRGIPYLDWGVYGENNIDWVRRRDLYGTYSSLKNVYSQAQQAEFSDHNFWAVGATANNLNLFRFSDLLLMAAEIEIELGDLEKARGYINRVRTRAANPEGWVRNNAGQPAAHYNIGTYDIPFADKNYARKVVRFERMLELGMEGHRFFDLVRWGIADQEINFYLKNEKNRGYLNRSTFKKGINELFPIPQKQIDLSAGLSGIPKMKQNPGY